MHLSARQHDILQAIVEDYINSAEPVGSRTVSKKIKIPVSSATIRNEMSDLEEMGLITQQHLSSGRIPTQKGLRFYIDCIVALERLSNEESEIIDNIRKNYALKKQHLKELITDISKTLSNVMDYPSIVIAPKLTSEKFKKIQFLLLDDKNILITLVTCGGLIEYCNFKTESPLVQERLNSIAADLNNMEKGFTVSDINGALNARAIIQKNGSCEKLNIENIFNGSLDDRIILTGTENILKKPEFQNSEKMKLFIEIINDKEKILKLLTDEKAVKNFMDDTIVLIGDELEDLRDLSLGLVASEYKDSEDACGVLGIIGPSRMEYSKIISLVREFATRISKTLKNKGQ